jgi:hypothetical protein
MGIYQEFFFVEYKLDVELGLPGGRLNLDYYFLTLCLEYFLEILEMPEHAV